MRIGRVQIGLSFLLLAAWLNYLDRQMLVPRALAACALHELGHLTAIRLAGGRVRQIRISAVGAEMILDRPLSYWQEGLSALAGPGANLAAALICCQRPWGMLFAGLNLVLACFNMMPIPGLDGGRVLNCTLSLLAGPRAADKLVWWIGAGCTAALLVAGGAAAGAGGNLTLLLVAVWSLYGVVKGNSSDRKGKRACHRGRKQVKYKVRV